MISEIGCCCARDLPDDWRCIAVITNLFLHKRSTIQGLRFIYFQIVKRDVTFKINPWDYITFFWVLYWCFLIPQTEKKYLRLLQLTLRSIFKWRRIFIFVFLNDLWNLFNLCQIRVISTFPFNYFQQSKNLIY